MYGRLFCHLCHQKTRRFAKSNIFLISNFCSLQFLFEVVSFYSDLDMDEGVVIPVEDFVEAYNEGDWYDWGGYGGASAAAGRPQRPHHRPNRTVSTASTVASPKPSPPGGGPGRKLTRKLTQNQPWLEGRQNSHHFHDFQLLWTDEALGKLPVMTSGRVIRWGENGGEVVDVDPSLGR